MKDARSSLGIKGYLASAEVASLVSALRKLWTETVQRSPGDLEKDLEASRRWFDPVAQGGRLRRELGLLIPVPTALSDPGPPLTIDVGEGKLLVTPEGRCALDLLEKLASDRRGHMIDDQLLQPYERRLALMYRDWSRHRLNSVIELLSGTTKPLQIPAAGVVITLLVNRCSSESRALTRFSSGPARQVVDRAFFAPVQAFADLLAPSSRRKRSSARLVSGWMLYEARRRLGDGLVVVDARGEQNGKVWISPDATAHMIDCVARDLARGHRVHATLERFGEAYDALVRELREQMPALAGFGLMHERPLETRRLRSHFLERLSVHLKEPS